MPRRMRFCEPPASLLSSKEKLELLRRLWPNLPESVQTELWHKGMWSVRERTWRTVDSDPLPRPIILGEARHDPPPTSVWWKIIGTAALLATGGVLAIGGPALSWVAILNLQPVLAGPVAGFGVGLALGALTATGPAVKTLLRV